MSKLFVRNAPEDLRVPFLRGILVRSLQNAGLEFEAAYAIASEVREELRDIEEVSSEELHAHVLRHLEPADVEVAEIYRRRNGKTASIIVRYDNANTAQYSRGRQRLGLLCAGLKPEKAVSAAAQIHAKLIERGVQEIDNDDLRRLTYETLRESGGGKAARRYLTWQAYRRSNRPLLVLVGGATGTGKSTVAAQLSHVMDIVRTQSTDMLREAMRMMIPERLMPVLHRSSFSAWEALPPREWASDEERVAGGYLAQTEVLRVSCAAVLTRALKEGLSMVLEGIHVHPSLLTEVPPSGDAIVVPVMLGVLKPKDLERRIRGRGADVPARRAQRYLDNFDAIWALQTFLLDEADRTGMPIVANRDLDMTVRDVILAVLRTLAGEFDNSPEAVLGISP